MLKKITHTELDLYEKYRPLKLRMMQGGITTHDDIFQEARDFCEELVRDAESVKLAYARAALEE